MKNQYIGDIGDYGKYGLLRFLRDQGIIIGVNWYLTPKDGKTDGCHREYLQNEKMRVYDPELFDALKEMTKPPVEQFAIEMVEQSGLLEGVSFYHRMMDFDNLPWRERSADREKWHREAVETLNHTELFFADPDNGMLDIKRQKKGAQKYILPDEIADCYNRGQQVVYYQHRSRKPEKEWEKDKKQILKFLPEAKLLAVSFNRWSCRTYIFVLHEECFDLYSMLIDRFLASDWGSIQVDGKPAFKKESI